MMIVIYTIWNGPNAPHRPTAGFVEAARDGFQEVEQPAQSRQLAGVAVGHGAVGDQGQGGIDEGDKSPDNFPG